MDMAHFLANLSKFIKYKCTIIYGCLTNGRTIGSPAYECTVIFIKIIIL